MSTRRNHMFFPTYPIGATIIILLLSFSTAIGQITPSSPVAVGSTVTYTFDNGNIYLKRNWQITNGTINSTSFSGTSNSCSVTWSSTCGGGTLTFRNLTTVITDIYITISPASVSTPSTTFNTNTCRTVTVTRSTNPPACTSWYWQTSSTGESMSNSGSVYTPTSSTWLYLRAYTPYSGWSSAQTVGHIGMTTIDPAAPTGSNGSHCGTGSVSISATPAASADNIKWYAASSGGSALYTGTGYSPSLSSTTTYYATSFNTTQSCESLTRTAVVATVKPIPNAAASPVAICTGQATSISITNPNSVSGTTYAWTVSQSNVTGGSSGSGTPIAKTLTLTSGNEGSATFSVTPTADGCSGTPINVVATVSVIPQITVTGQVPLVTGSPTQLSTSSSYHQYQWINNVGDIAGATTLSYILPEPSSYKVKIKTSSGASWCFSAPTLVKAELDSQWTNVDMVSTTLVFKEGLSADAPLNALNNNEISQVNQFMDGLGRVFQTVVTGASPGHGDIVTPVGYGKDGYSDTTFLSYVTSTASGNLRRFAIRKVHLGYDSSEQRKFYIGTAKIATDSRPFALRKFRNTPDGRVIEQGAPGEAWHPDNTHTIRNQVTINSASYPVRYWKADGTSSGNYTAKTIIVSILTDENGNKVRTYTNKLGQTVLKQVQLDENIGGSMTGWLDTYYIYDNYGRLRYQVPPKAVALLDGTPSMEGDANLAELIYKYTYDDLGRLVEKKEPGAVVKYIVYDIYDRVVLTQDGTLRALGKWAFVKYDLYGRPVFTGLYANNRSRTSVQQWAGKAYTSSSTPYPEANFTEVKMSGADSLHGYSNVSFPKDSILRLAVSYYDNYDFHANGTPPFSYDNAHLSGIPAAASASVRGMATGSKRRLLSATGNVTANWIKGAVFYDSYDRVIQTQSNNHLDLNAIDKQSVLYNNIKRVEKTKSSHTAASTTTHITQWNDYDHAGRVLKTYHQINSQSVVLVAQYEYNALGQLIDKKLHNTGGSNFLQSVDYRYNIRGWLQSINNAQLSSDGTTNDEATDYFGMELAYTASMGTGNTAAYNGNVSAMKWKTLGEVSGAAGQRSYNYSYDKSDKLKAATFQANTGSAWTREANTLNEEMSYDQGGNMLTLTRNKNARTLGGTNTAAAMDNLNYGYTSNTNLLKTVEDSGMSSGFNNGSVAGSTEYTYNSDGSVTSDANKGISSITYNFLGKPQVVTFSNGQKVEYVYDAAGIKITMKTYNGATLLTTTDYAGGFVYAEGAINFFSSPEGRVVKNGSAYEYQYAIADHQGNTRVVFTSATPTPVEYTSDMEGSSNASFQGYTNRVNFELYDHTDFSGSTYTYSQKLTGASGQQVGVAKSFKVYPGDKVKIEAYAKYSSSSGGSNLAGFATALLGAFGLSTPGVGETGTPSAAVNSWGAIVAGGGGNGTGSDPKAFVNLLVVDKNYNFLDAAWDQINGGEQVGASPKAAHDHLVQEYVTREEGYIYVYVSNENATLVDVYFDDVKVTHTKSNLIQGNEYYPYGLQTANSWTRESTTGNNFLYNGGTELNQTTQVYDLYYRNYDPVLGRFGQVDPKASSHGPLSPYHYGVNNPARFNDPLGDDEYDFYMGIANGTGGSYVASGRGESVYRDMDPYGRYTTARIAAQSIEMMGMMRSMQDSQIDLADGIHTFIFGPNGKVNYSYTSDEEFNALLASGYGVDVLRTMFSGAPIIGNYQSGPRLWEDSKVAGGFVQIRAGNVYFAYTDKRYFRSAAQDQTNGDLAGHAWGINLTAIAGGGFAFSLGFVRDNKTGGGSFFYSYGVGVGLNAGLSGFGSDITNRGGYEFSYKHYAGTGSSHNYSFLEYSHSRGGNTNNFSSQDYGITYLERSGGAGLGTSLGYSFEFMNTVLFWESPGKSK